MSATAKALLFKLVMTFIFAWVTLTVIDANPVGWVLLIAVLGAGANYLLGDLVVLPRFGNTIASIGDGATAGLLAYIMDLIVPAIRTTGLGLILFAALVAFAELFFHQYLLSSKKVAP